MCAGDLYGGVAPLNCVDNPHYNRWLVEDEQLTSWAFRPAQQTSSIAQVRPQSELIGAVDQKLWWNGCPSHQIIIILRTDDDG